MRKSFILVILTIVFVGILSSVVQAFEAEKLMNAAIQEIKDLAMPYTSNHQVQYSFSEERVIVSFDTDSNFKYNYNLYYLLWWDCQFIALNAFAKRGFPVKAVAVYTNLEDNSGLMLMVTEAPYITKYANAVDGMSRWLDLTDSFIWNEASQTWRPVPK